MSEEIQSPDYDGGSLVLLWAGESPAINMNLLEGLEAAGIPAQDKPLGSDGAPRSATPLPIDWKPRFGFEIYVLSTDFPAAKEILEDVLERTPPDTEIPAQPEVVDPAAKPSEVKNEPATLEIWAGTDPKLAEFLLSAFSENSISARAESAGAQITIYIAPHAAMQAVEILREVLEGAPPA
jgi:hypothetical protein